MSPGPTAHIAVKGASDAVYKDTLVNPSINRPRTLRGFCRRGGRAARSGTNLPLHGFDSNGIWCEIVFLACELTISVVQILTLVDHPARQREPKRLRLLLFSTATRLSRNARTTWL
jgi:hypothetical protein